MNKKEEQKDLTFTISQAVPQLGLNSREKFVCLRVFNEKEKYTLIKWEQLIKQKGIK